MTEASEALHPEGDRQRLYFHVGLPKSGSTYLQSILGNNRTALREAGFVYPYVRQEGMFLAAVEMVGSAHRWGLDADDIEGTFAHLLRRGRRLGGTVVLSHEVFSAASEERVRAMGEMLADFEVHVVVTARDLGRTVTAGWQEHVKNGHAGSFRHFSDHLLARLPEDLSDVRSFWPAQNLAAVLDRWRLVAPPERTHVVTCPPSGAAPDLLWQRFAEAVGLPPEAVDLSEASRRNESLGTGQVAFLRRVVVALDGRLEQPWFSRVAKRWFAQTLLSRAESPRPVTPAPVVERLAALSSVWSSYIEESGYQVHGDLAELVPQPPDPSAPHPDVVTDTDMLSGLPEVVAEMLLRTGELNVEIANLRSELESLTQDRDDLAARLEGVTAEVSDLAARPWSAGVRHWRRRLSRRSATQPSGDAAGR